MTLTDHKKATGKTWARIAAELSECALARDADRINRILEGRVYSLVAGKRAKSWEVLALADYLGEGATYN